MDKIFGENGILSNIHQKFEIRHEQSQMAEFILESLYCQNNGLVEAGTGVGKTLAYLVPAIFFCITNNKRLAITTETKALQKQLVDKDLPLVKRIITNYLEKDFSYSIALGSSNYPCRKRFELLLSAGNFLKKDVLIVKALKERFSMGSIFTHFDIIVPKRIWTEISRDAEACNHFHCPFSAMCVFQKARREWTNSTVLVMNHYLFFSNLMMGKSYLPKFDVVIFDEAHSIEGIATDQLGFDVNYNQVMDIISRFYKKDRKSNIISRISKVLLRKRAIKKIEEIKTKASFFFEKLRGMFGPNQYTLRLAGSLSFGKDLIESLKEFFLILVAIEDEIEEENRRIEFDIIRGRLFHCLQNIEATVNMQNSNFVYWIERNEYELLGNIHIKGGPIDISEIMLNEVNSFYDTCLYVSATLAIKNEFSFTAKRLGVHDYKSLLLNSPFNYKEQVILYLSKEIGEPKNPFYIERASRISNEIIKIVGGNCLLLFTSYKMMNDVKNRLLKLIDSSIYAQGDYSTTEAIEKYINDNGSILMGTHSFWQGLDLPGDLLRGLILMRLPFSVPDFPPVQAMIERLTEEGLNPFYSYQVPSAIIKFKQGFGRLIRSSEDKGIVAVLDSRILIKNYGRFFINSLPECRSVDSIEALKLVCVEENYTF